MIRQRLPTSELDGNEVVLFFPSFGHRMSDGFWKIHITGAVYELGPCSFRNRFLIRVLERIMRPDTPLMDNDLFRQRIGPFIATAERGKQVVIELGTRRFALANRSKRDGQFGGSIYLSDHEARALSQGPHGARWINFHLAGAKSECPAAGRAQLIEPEGVSIVSDIDDTIKHTQVSCRKTLLRNTFLRDFQCIEGMADAYHQWQQAGAAFHYVSSSPWQLLEPLERLCHSAGFPAGSFHLRVFRWRDQMVKRVMRVRRSAKRRVISKLINYFPQRRFVLIGDSGEHDPEIYADLARRFGSQVTAIKIRELGERPLSTGRQERLARGLKPGTLQVFHEAGELPRDLGL